MATVHEIVERQKDGAQFVISAQMLKMKTEDFDAMVNTWLQQGAPGFALTAMPHRKVIDGEFFIDRITAIKTAKA
ncbi:MAG TPA: hypothetical protein VHL60_13520 [Oxalicibacterium sp.]|jgi:hypothetical protein|nr:hypothetical protein [Oxalicibacterium sp.]